MPVRRPSVLALAGAAAGVVVLLSGCASSSGSSNAAGPATSAAPVSSAASTPSDTASSPSAVTVSGGDFCQTIVQEKKALTDSALPQLLQGGGADAWKKYIAATAAMNNLLYDAAPDELKGDIDTLRQVNVKIGEMMSAANYDITKVKVSQLLATMSAADFKKASADFTSYVKTHCSIDLSKA